MVYTGHIMNQNTSEFHITVFDSLYDTNTAKTITKRNWCKFRQFLSELAEIEYTKQTAPLISPAVYEEGTTRSNANVVAWGGWCAIDVDTHPFSSMNEIEQYLLENHSEKQYICYSTASSTINKPKFRLVFPLTHWITKRETIQKFWWSLNKEFGGLVDKQTKDVSRMYFVPASYKESDNNFFFWHNEGASINPDKLIFAHGANELFITASASTSFIDMLPEKMKQSVIDYRKQQLESNGKYYSWTSYRDCPFVNKERVNEYRGIVMRGDEGRYRGLYQLMVSIAASAIKKHYPIQPNEVCDLVLEIDGAIDGLYQRRKIQPESERAIAFVYRTGGEIS